MAWRQPSQQQQQHHPHLHPLQPSRLSLLQWQAPACSSPWPSWPSWLASWLRPRHPRHPTRRLTLAPQGLLLALALRTAHGLKRNESWRGGCRRPRWSWFVAPASPLPLFLSLSKYGGYDIFPATGQDQLPSSLDQFALSRRRPFPPPDNTTLSTSSSALKQAACSGVMCSLVAVVSTSMPHIWMK